MSLATIFSLDISRFVFFAITLSFSFSFANVTTVFLLQLWFLQFCHFFVNIRFSVSLFNYLQLKNITDTCYGALVGSLTVLPLSRFGLAQDADVEEGLTEAGAAQPAAGHRAPLAATAATFAAGASASTAAAGAAAATSAPGPSNFHDSGGHGPHSSFPPVYYEYPSLCTAFSQRISDLVGRSRKEDALAILKEFDKSTKRAQEYARKASEHAIRSHDLMASAHQECFSSMNKLLADATAAKQASKGRRRKATNVTQVATGMSFFIYFFTIMLLPHVSRRCNHTHNLFANIHLISPFFCSAARKPNCVFFRKHTH
jgi:hypothetical protein